MQLWKIALGKALRIMDDQDVRTALASDRRALVESGDTDGVAKEVI